MKVTTSKLDNTNESQKVRTFSAGDHKANQNKTRQKLHKRNNINEPQKKHRLGTVSKSILLEDLNRFNGVPTSPLVQMWIKTHRCLVCMKASSHRTYESRYKKEIKQIQGLNSKQN